MLTIMSTVSYATNHPDWSTALHYRPESEWTKGVLRDLVKSIGICTFSPRRHEGVRCHNCQRIRRIYDSVCCRTANTSGESAILQGVRRLRWVQKYWRPVSGQSQRLGTHGAGSMTWRSGGSLNPGEYRTIAGPPESFGLRNDRQIIR